MATAIELIRTNYDKALYITRLAKTFGIGPSSFHHHFKSATTMSPSTQNVDAPGLQTANILKVPVSDRDTFEDLSQSPSFRSHLGCKSLILNGEMSEWLKEHAWK